MLPSWFAEYSLDLGITAFIVSLAPAGYGWIVATTGRFGDLLSDMSRYRKPATIVEIGGALIGVAVAWAAFETSGLHLRLALSAIATVLLLVGIAGVAMYPFSSLWRNEFWGLPPAQSMTEIEVRRLGTVYKLTGLAFAVAIGAVMVGLVPKLLYVGSPLIAVVLVVAELIGLGLAVAVGVKAWRLMRSLRMGPSVHGLRA